ncbi:hypothetical protein LXL04_007356 [Taraxacum kok-saghyz]
MRSFRLKEQGNQSQLAIVSCIKFEFKVETGKEKEGGHGRLEILIWKVQMFYLILDVVSPLQLSDGLETEMSRCNSRLVILKRSLKWVNRFQPRILKLFPSIAGSSLIEDLRYLLQSIRNDTN